MKTFRKRISGLYKLIAVFLAFFLITPHATLALPASGTKTQVTKTYQYDGNGNLISRTDGNGNVTTFGYDKMDRLISIDYPGGDSPDISFTYDQNGNLTSTTDLTGTTGFDYDFYDRLIGIDYPDGNFVKYGYDNVGNIVDLQYGNRTVHLTTGTYTYIHYGFDENNRIKSVQNVFTDDTTSYTYDLAGSLKRRTLPNGAYTEYGYDEDGRLTSVKHYRQDQSLICKYEYTLNAMGNRTQVTETTPEGPKTTKYRYDELDRLDVVIYPDGKIVDYDYDTFGNRIKMTETFQGVTKTREYFYDSGSRLLYTTLDGQPEEYFSYDKTGNLIQKVRVTDNRQIEYRYDFENRLVQYFDGTDNVEYVYNGLGMRMAKSVNGIRTDFINDINRDYVQVLAETDELGEAKRVYEWGIELINQADIYGDNPHYYLHDSINGSVRRLIDKEQAVISTYEYDAFGEPRKKVEGIANDYQFHGEVQEEETGLVFLRARYYGPEIGRFLTRDPYIGNFSNTDSLNPYMFAKNDPVNYIDRSGAIYIYFGCEGEYTNRFGGIFQGGIVFNFPSINYSTWSVKEFTTLHGSGGINKSLSFVFGINWRNDISFSKFEGMGKSFNFNLNKVLTGSVTADKEGISGLSYTPGWGPGGLSISEGITKIYDIHESHYGGFGRLTLELTKKVIGLEGSIFEADRPGGIALNKTADVLLNINEITGGTYDPATGQIIIYGKEDNSSTAMPPMDIDDLAVAFHAVNLGTMPVVSIEDPIVDSPPEWPGRECFTVRYGPFHTNPETGELEVLDIASKTHFGWVMYDADRHMKCLGVGKDNRDDTPVSSNVPGYNNLVDLAFMYLPQGTTLTRFWFHPKEIVIAPSADGRSMEFKNVEMQLSTETMFSSEGQVESTPDAEYFANHFTQHYDEFAEEQVTYDDEGNPHYIFKELKQLAALVGIVEWIKKSNIPMDLSFLENYTPKYYDSAPDYTPTTTSYDIRSVGGFFTSYTVWGGVNYCTELDFDTEGDPNALAQAAVDSRAGETNLAWSFNQNGQEYNATALSVDRKEKYGSFSHSDVDAFYQVNGAFPLILTRHFDSFNVTRSMFGWGWRAVPYSLDFKGQRGQLNLCTQQWEGFSDIWFNDYESHAAYRFEPSGIYDKESDPLGVASGFDQNEIILVYRFEEKDIPGLLFTDNKTGILVRLTDGNLLHFDLDGRLIQTEDRSANIIKYTYDETNRLVSVGQPGGRAISFIYDDQNRVKSALLPDGHSITYTYDENSNLKSAQADAPIGKLIQYNYSDDHLLIEVQDERGKSEATLSYDLYGRVTNTMQPGVATPFTQEYSLKDKTSQTTGPESFSQILEFNDDHDLIKMTDSCGNSTTMTYNSQRDMTTMTSPDGWTREYYYDYRGNQIASIHPNRRADVTFFDLNNNPVLSFHSPANANFYSCFDPEHVLTAEDMDIDPVNLTRFSYDASGNLTKITDANGNEYTFGYDATGNLIWEKDGQGRQTTYTYDGYSRLIRIENELDHEAGFSYDEKDNLIQVATKAGKINYTYNDKSQLVRITSGDPGMPRTTKYTYNAKGQIETVRNPGGIVTEYAYDERGNLTQIKHDGIVHFTYEYDGLNRLKAVHYTGTAGGGKAAIVPARSVWREELEEDNVTYNEPDGIDSDFDGFPDEWELANGLDPKDPFGENGAFGDPDKDGFTNRKEFFGNSNPKDHNSVPPTPPVITHFTPAHPSLFILEEEEIVFSVNAMDVNGDSISYLWRLNGEDKATTDSWTFVTTDESSGMDTLLKEYVIELFVTAGSDQVSHKWTVLVKNQNHAPILEPIPDLSVQVGDTVQLDPVFYDPDNKNGVSGDDNELRVAYSGWMSGPSKMVTIDDYGVKTATISVCDDGDPARCSRQTIQITIEAPNLQPHQPQGWDGSIVISPSKGNHMDASLVGIGRPCYIDFAQKNEGGIVAGPSSAQLLIDGNIIDMVDFPEALPPNASCIEEDILYSFSTVGQHTIELKLDVDDEVIEGDETDNSFTKIVNVSPIVKQFEETSYNLKDICLINENLGWAVGAPHWDQNEKRYKRTIIKTEDGGETWVAQEAGIGGTLKGVCFIDENNGWVVGENGTIMHTEDGGESWIENFVLTNDEFRGVNFIDANHGWATCIRPVGVDSGGSAEEWRGSVWHTNDGGETWAQQSLPKNTGILNRIEFINVNIGWAVGNKVKGYDKIGHPEQVAVIYHTNDGGQTWEEQYTPETSYYYSAFNLPLDYVDMVFTGLDFVDANNGWVVGFKGTSSLNGPTLFHTGDGGETWEPQYESGFFKRIWDIHFIDPNMGYMVGTMYGAAWGPPVLRTLDGGNTWESVRMSRHDGEGLYGLSVAGDQVIAVGDHDFCVRSTDAWKSCDWVFPEPTCLNCDCLFEQWYINIHYRFEDVFFLDDIRGWVVGSRSFKPELWGQVILHTQDGGLTWESQYEKAPPVDGLFSYFRLDSVYFIDSRNGWATGSAELFLENDRKSLGAILHTTDGGEHWEEQGLELKGDEFFAVHFIDSQNGWALDKGHNSPLINNRALFFAHTTDGGTNWEWIDTGIEGSMSVGFAYVQGDLVFTGDQYGWAAGGLGEIIHTEDDGATWVKQELSCGYPSCLIRLFAIDFIDNQVGWIAGEELYHTTDGGNTWIKKDIEIGADLQDIQFIDHLNGWLVGESATMLYTIDGGNNWNRIDNVTSSNLRGLSFVSPQKGWAAGDEGTIINIFNPHILEGNFDNDSLPDNWEQQHFNGLSYDGTGDSDDDGLTDFEEYQNNTDPKDNDTDNDGMPDGWELHNDLNPLLNDASEDKDGDGMNNRKEFEEGYDPSVPSSVIESIYANPETGEPPLQVEFSASVSGSVKSWHWNFDDGLTSNEQNPIHVFASPGFFSIYLTVTGIDGSPDTERTSIYIKNPTPCAEAGPDQIVKEAEEVVLNGSNSFVHNDFIKDYQWEQINGPNLTLYNANSALASFVAPDVGPDGATITFQLTVETSNWDRDTDTVKVEVLWENEPPVADAGPDLLFYYVPSLVRLDGSNSKDMDDDIKSYDWKQIAGNTVVTLSDPTAVKPTFIYPDVKTEGASMAFELYVADNNGLQDNDIVIVNIREEISKNLEFIYLQAGWNLISFQIAKCFYEEEIPVLSIINSNELEFEVKESLLDWLNDDLESPVRDAVDSNMAGDWQRITSFDETGAHLMDKDLPSFVNTLHYLSCGYGYWIKMNKPGVLKLQGQLATLDTTLNLKEGWNLMGFIPSDICYVKDNKAMEEICPFNTAIYAPEEGILYCPLDLLIDIVFVSISGKYRRITSFDACSGAMIHDIELPSFVNTINYMGPKYGYWIKMEEDAEMIFPYGCPNQ